MTRRPGPTHARIETRLAAAMAVVAVVIGAFAPGLQPSATAETPTQLASAAGAASTWLAGRATNGAISYLGSTDWGLTADTVFAHAAAGHGATAGAEATDQLAAHVADYVGSGTKRSAGALAKVFLAAVVQGRDVSNFGGMDLRAEMLALLNTTPGDVNRGRFQNVGQGDTSNGFSQSLAIIALGRTGTVPQSAVDYLLLQVCPTGGYRLFYAGAGCVNELSADPDTTAMVVEALTVAGTAGAQGTAVPLTNALDWLVSQQQPDGSFLGSGPTNVPNADSTGLVAQALRAGGRTAAADKATAWLRSIQIDCDQPALSSQIGAIAYGPDEFAATVAAGTIEPVYADQYNRATSQGILGLGGPSLATLTASYQPDAPDAFDCEATPPSTEPESTSSIPAGGSSTVPTSSTAPTSSTSTSSTSTTSTIVSTSTTSSTTTTIAVGLGAGVSIAQPSATVEGISESAPSAGSSTSGPGLAVTGGNVATVVSFALLVAAVGVGLLGLRRRTR